MGLATKSKSNDFPVGENIKDCYVRKIEYKTGERPNGEFWEALMFHIVKNGEWITLFLPDVDKSKYTDINEQKRRKEMLRDAIERMVSLYLTKPEMIDFVRGLGNIKRHFRAYCEYVIETLESLKDKKEPISRDYRDVSIDIKTSPRREGGAIIMPVGIFAKRSDDITQVLQYTDWEEDRIENLHKY